MCWRNCGELSAGHFHIFWHCSKIAPFWTIITREIKTITGLNLSNDFPTIYLGNLPQELTKADRYLVSILLAGAKKAITRKWLCEDVPSLKDWTQVVDEIYEMERLTFSIRLSTDKCQHFWKKWDRYIKLNAS